jgi:multidrug efflux pump subunit AcrA (membrane-fusion protein)
MRRRRAQSSVRWVVGSTLGVGAAIVIVLASLRLTASEVVVTEAVEGPVVQAFYSTGTIQPERDYPIKANIPGTLTAVHVDKGDVIKADQALAVVTDPELEYIARRAAAELQEKQKRADPKNSPDIQEYDARITAAQAQLDIAQREQDRIKGLIERNAAAQTDLDSAMDRVKTIWAQVEANKSLRAAKQLERDRELAVAQAALDTANWNLQQQTLKAPIDGSVLDRPLALRTHVAINDRIMTVADVRPEKLVMRAAVDEEDVTSAHVGQTVRMTLYAYEGRSFEGKVQKIYPQADEARRTFEVDVKILDPDSRLAPGMTGELAFIIDEKDKAIVIPSQAVQKGTVYTVQNGRLKKLDTEIGLRGIERVEVRTGVKSGERVVVSAIGDLHDGDRVRTTYMDPVTAAGINKPKQKTDSFKGFN